MDKMKYRKRTSYIILTILVILTVFAWQAQKNHILERERLRYTEYVDLAISSIEERIKQYEMLLHGSVGLFGDVTPVTLEEWTGFFEYHQIDTLNPGIRDAVYLKVVQSAALVQYEEELRAEGYLEDTVWPKGQREVYTPVTLIAPYNEKNQIAIGFDAYSDPVRRATLEKARDTGVPTITEKLTVVSETGSNPPQGFLMIIPVYTNKTRPETIEERRAFIKGYVSSFFRIEELMDDIFLEPFRKIDFELYDGNEIRGEALFYDSHISPKGDRQGNKPMFSSIETIDFYGRQWTVAFESTPAFEDTVDHYSRWIIFFSGLVISFAIFFYLRVMMKTEARARMLAEEMTVNIRENNERVTHQKKAITDLILDNIFHSGEIGPILSRFTEVLSRTLDVERSSIWILDDSNEELKCLTLYEKKLGKHSSGFVLQAKNLPLYMSAIKNEGGISTKNAQEDPLMSELAQDYLKPLGITSMMETGIFTKGRLRGVVSSEHLGNPRKWHDDEKTFVSTIATLTSLVFIEIERQELQETIKKSNELYKSVVATQTEMISRYKPDTTLIFVNEAYCRAFGKKQSELLGKKYLTFIPPELHEEEIASLKKLSPAHPRDIREFDVTLPDGSTRWQEWTDIAIFNESGEMIEIQGVGRDITERKQSEKDLLNAYDATIAGWAHALDLKDEETQDHSKRVTELTIRIAMKMGIKEEELTNVRRGALLHDIGKMGIPDKILLKPGKLTDEEWEIMFKHPVFAFEMLSSIDYLRPALDIPYCHHEKWDGSGYPRGLKGEQIPLAARIFAVVDVYDALTSDRPYRKAWTKEKTLEYIQELSGKHFDPQILDVFVKEMCG